MVVPSGGEALEQVLGIDGDIHSIFPEHGGEVGATSDASAVNA